ncbi:hypothetical protein D9Q98_005327 [Chlorella vulgaris]|uniref:Uncharacterized protein n=1 Tax=Chlorella vulgaris TaxID=3077 RepID=A0A9D4TLP5_CHLVU|nr:hypothetical protein D9Q98_005327 [Chlorella vulgaris]
MEGLGPSTEERGPSMEGRGCLGPSLAGGAACATSAKEMRSARFLLAAMGVPPSPPPLSAGDAGEAGPAATVAAAAAIAAFAVSPADAANNTWGRRSGGGGSGRLSMAAADG